MKNIVFRYRNYSLLFGEHKDAIDNLIGREKTNLIESSISIFTPSVQQLNLQDQFDMVGSISNFHKWEWPGMSTSSGYQIKFERKHSAGTRWPPASPRNCLLNALVNDKSEAILATCQVLLGITPDKSITPQPKRERKQPVIKKAKMSLSAVERCESLGISIEEANASSENVNENKMKLFDYYLSQLKGRGTIKWRYIENDKEVLVMNAYDAKNGDFKVMYFAFCLSSSRPLQLSRMSDKSPWDFPGNIVFAYNSVMEYFVCQTKW